MRNSSFLPVIILTILLSGCSIDDSFEYLSTYEIDGAERPFSDQLMSTPAAHSSCSSDYVFPTKNSGPKYATIRITFDPLLSLEEVNCVKIKYFTFEFKESLFMNSEQENNDPYEENWLILKGKPEGDLISDVEDDPLSTSFICGD